MSGRVYSRDERGLERTIKPVSACLRDRGYAYHISAGPPEAQYYVNMAYERLDRAERTKKRIGPTVDLGVVLMCFTDRMYCTLCQTWLQEAQPSQAPVSRADDGFVPVQEIAYVTGPGR